MKRTDFIKTSGIGCLALLSGSTLFQSCTSTRIVSVISSNNELRISKAEFNRENGKFHRYVLITTESLDNPIVVYRKEGDVYISLLLRCTHQGTELTVYGDLISCPAHGSEFSSEGGVINGPASRNLQSFKTECSAENIIIYLS